MAEQQFPYDMMVQEALKERCSTITYAGMQRWFSWRASFLHYIQNSSAKCGTTRFLHQQYPEEMTIVLQHQFWNLQVNEKYFEVELSFNDKRENLVIPFGAVTGFADPQSNSASNLTKSQAAHQYLMRKLM